ncbi:MAG: hypothetical protein ACRCTR_09035 [Actinomycetota bacterium]
MKKSSIRRSLAAGCAALAVVGVSVVAPTAAQATEGNKEERLERACGRIPDLQERTTKLLDRLEGDAETRGSTAWIEAQIDRAEKAGRDQAVTALENRLKVRKSIVTLLPKRVEGLDKLAQKCSDKSAA